MRGVSLYRDYPLSSSSYGNITTFRRLSLQAATPVSFTDGLMRAVIGEDFSTREQDNSTKGYIESRPVDENGIY